MLGGCELKIGEGKEGRRPPPPLPIKNLQAIPKVKQKALT